MNQKKFILIVLAVLLAVTAGLAYLHLVNSDRVPEGAVALDYQGSRRFLEKSFLERGPVVGTIVNGKGDEIAINAKGVTLSELLHALKIEPESVSAIRVTAQDEFSAEVTREELFQPDKAFLIVTEDSVALVVFGDGNAKRNVQNVAVIEVIS